ncbi:MAG: extracellular solute-binding protein [Spirochaetaceae bacterium]
MKKILMLSIVFLLALSTYASGNKEAESGEMKKMDISIGYWDISTYIDSANKDEFTKYIEERFNVNIVPRNFGWGDWNEKALLWGASDDLPDVFASAMMLQDVYYQWVDEGLLRALPSDMSAYPVLNKVVNQPAISSLKIDGDLYMFPRLNAADSSYNSAERGIMSRKDWREELGIPKPETFDDYLALAKAFTENDLDGNGVNDTIGMTFRSKALVSMALLSTVPEAASKTWKKEDGKWIPGYASKDMVKGIKELNTLWKSGVVDGDVLSYNGKEGNEVFAQGNTGMLFTGAKANKLKDISELWEKYNDSDLTDKIEFLPIWKNEEGKRYAFHEGKNFWSSSYFSAHVSDEKMAKIMEIYNFLLSTEGVNILKFGIPGIDMTDNGNDVTVNDKSVDLEKKYPSIGIFRGLPVWFNDMSVWVKDGFSLAMYPEDVMDVCINQYDDSKNSLSPVNMGIQYLSTPNKAKFERGDLIFDSVIVAMISDDPETEWNNQMDQLRAEGLDGAIEEVNQKAKELGIK